MSDYHEWSSIQAVTPTLCGLMGVDVPAACAASSLVDVMHQAEELLNGKRVEKILVYAADAIGNHLYRRHPSWFDGVTAVAPISAQLQSVLPAVTPVCFASMFTGASPIHHGIQAYEKPVLRCDTIFDALIRAGKRMAIVAVKGSSIDRIFRERSIDYYSEEYDPQVTERVISLLKSDHHDFILAYHQEYDDALHATNPFSEKACQGAKNDIATFVQLAEALDRYWSRYDRAIAFTPDHGAHLDPASGRGGHGIDIPEDMEVTHCFGLRRGGC